MQNDIISVVIPVHNSQEHISRTLDSVLAQDYENIEIICVNDGSTDNSLDILNEYQTEYKNIDVISIDNSGVVTARNVGIEKSSGKYILPLDSDDIIDKSCITKLHDAMKSGKYGVVSPGIGMIGERTGPLKLPVPSAVNMSYQNCIVNCGLFLKSNWKKYGGYDNKFDHGIEDYDFWWNFLQDNKKIYRTPEILFYYRIKPTNQSRNQKNINIHNELVDLMLQKYSLMRKYRKVAMANKLPYQIVKSAYIKSRRTARRVASLKNILLFPKYKHYLHTNHLNKEDFVPINKKPLDSIPSKKAIAFYLPQYYHIRQNDEWFGKGFTEWTNVTKALPQYINHWQPHLPIDVGFYNLETTHVMHRQIELAKLYGIYGFCFYYYWFSGGDKIMEKPIQNWLNDKSIDFPFMFFWANEDWTNNWGEKEDLGTKVYSAKMNESDVELFVEDILPYIKDSRYIKIDDRPHIIIYQAKKDPYLPTFISLVKKNIKSKISVEPYVSLVYPDDKPEEFDPRTYGADAAVEFGVHMRSRPDHAQQPIPNSKILNKLSKITSYDMQEFVDSRSYIYATEYTNFKGVMTTFDNTARKLYTGAYIFSLSPQLYKAWLSNIISSTEQDYVFISAWNEWAEGMHLEPDSRYGYAYLEATRDALTKK